MPVAIMPGRSYVRSEETFMLEKLLLPEKHAIAILIKDHDKVKKLFDDRGGAGAGRFARHTRAQDDAQESSPRVPECTIGAATGC